MDYIPAANPAPKRPRSRRTIGIVCDACGKQLAICYAYNKHQTSGYLIGTPCRVLDDGSTRTILAATERRTISTAMLQKLKLARR